MFSHRIVGENRASQLIIKVSRHAYLPRPLTLVLVWVLALTRVTSGQAGIDGFYVGEAPLDGPISGPIGTPGSGSGGVNCFGDRSSDQPLVSHGTVAVYEIDSERSDVHVVLERADPDRTYSIEIVEAATNADCGRNDFARTDTVITTDSDGNADAVVSLPLPYDVGGQPKTLGDGEHTEAIVVTLDFRDSCCGNGDRFASGPIPIRRSQLSSLGVQSSALLLRTIPERLFRVTIPEEQIGSPLRVAVEGTEALTIYAAWNRESSRTIHDYASAAPGRNRQSILIPNAVEGDLFIRVRATSFVEGVNQVSFRTDAVGLSIESISTRLAERNSASQVSMGVFGSGFTSDTDFTIENKSVTLIPFENRIITTSRAELRFEIEDAPEGFYDLLATIRNQEPFSYSNALEIVQPQARAHLDVRVLTTGTFRTARFSRLSVRYQNDGLHEIPAPLLRVRAELLGDQGDFCFYLDRDGECLGTEALLLASHPGGVAGRLPPGAVGEIPLWFVYHPEHPIVGCNDAACWRRSGCAADCRYRRASR